MLAGFGRVPRVDWSEASVLLRKIQSFSDPRLYALSMVAQELAHSEQPLVPERVFMAGGNASLADGNGNAAASGLLGLLINLMVAEKSGFQPSEGAGNALLEAFADRMSKQAMEAMEHAMDGSPADANPAAVPAPTNGASTVAP